MVSHLFYDQLALCVLVWLFVMWHVTGSKPGLPAPPVPAQPKRTRSSEPQPFVGLTHKPHGVLCEQETGESAPAPPVRPDPLPPTNRRPRTVDTSRHCCPYTDCAYRGGLGLNTLRAHGHPSGGPWRPLQGLGCHGSFLATHGTLFPGKQAAGELIVRVLACLAEGLGMRATARVFEVDPHTVLHWLGEAAEQLHACSASFLCDVHVRQRQRDELSAVWREGKTGARREDEASKRLERSPSWGWTAMDPESTWRLVIAGGTRTLERAQRVGHRVVQV